MINASLRPSELIRRRYIKNGKGGHVHLVEIDPKKADNRLYFYYTKMIIHTRFGEAAFGSDVTVNSSLCILVPSDVQGTELWIK